MTEKNPATTPPDGHTTTPANVTGRNRHQVEWVAAGLRRAAAEIGVDLPVNYSQTVAADGLTREPELAVTRLGSGVVIHTSPRSDKRLPIVVGYADGRGQWYRDGRRHTDPAVEASAQPAQGMTL